MHRLEFLKWYIESGEMSKLDFVMQDGRKVKLSKLALTDCEEHSFAYCFRSEIVIDDLSVMGDIMAVADTAQFAVADLSLRSLVDKVVLILTLSDNGTVCRVDGRQVPVVVLSPAEELLSRFEQLVAGADNFGCGRFMATMPDVERVNLCTKLLVERLEDKCRAMDEILDSTDYNWTETFYIMMMRMIGMGSNQQNYLRLAQRVPYRLICREKSSLFAVEAMLLGAAGFLIEPVDEYSVRLSREFEHIQYKYGIRPMRRIDWRLSGGQSTRPNSYPVVRLAQIAALLCSKDFMFDKAMNCRSVDDIKRLFAIQASDYWNTHYTFGAVTRERIKAISTDTFGVLGINVVCIAMFRYGKYTMNEELQEAAFDLLEQIEAEHNSIISGWLLRGVKVESAYFSQAMLQLSKIYCAKKRCGSCFVGKTRMKSE